MDQQTVFLTILGMAAVTYLPRLLPTWLLSSRELPRWLVAWLRNVPVAVLAAMLLPSIVTQRGQLYVSHENLFLLAAVPTLLMAWTTRSLFGSVITGITVVSLARLLLRR